MEFEGKGAVVTGASRGLGLEVSKLLAREGAHVVMIARGEDELRAAEHLVNDAAKNTGNRGSAHALAYDVGDKDAVHRISGAAAALASPIEIVVHAASTLGPLPMPLLFDTACEDLERVLAVNLIGPFRLTKALAAPMVLRERGVVVFVSSDAAVEAYARWGAYSVSKAAQDHLARIFAEEVRAVRFLSVDPGEMDTKMHADAIPDADRATLARPADVAKRVLTVIARAETFPKGARLRASELEPYEARGARR